MAHGPVRLRHASPEQPRIPPGLFPFRGKKSLMSKNRGEKRRWLKPHRWETPLRAKFSNERPSVHSSSCPEFFERFEWQGQQGSNPRPTVLETVALPTELYPYGAAVPKPPPRRRQEGNGRKCGESPPPLPLPLLSRPHTGLVLPCGVAAGHPLLYDRAKRTLP